MFSVNRLKNIEKDTNMVGYSKSSSQQKKSVREKHSVNELLESDGHFKELFDHIQVGIVLIDEAPHEIMEVNRIAEKIIGTLKIEHKNGDGEITKKLTISAHRFSKTAEAKITAAGGT